MNSILNEKSPFVGERVLLRSIELTDVPYIMKHRNTHETRIGLGVYIPDSSLQIEEWVKEITEKRKKGESFVFAIIDKLTNNFLGVCSLTKVNKINRGAFLGVAIYPILDAALVYTAWIRWRQDVATALKQAVLVLTLAMLVYGVANWINFGVRMVSLDAESAPATLAWALSDGLVVVAIVCFLRQRDELMRRHS